MPEPQGNIVCIIPAFNEDVTVGEIAGIVATHPLITHTLVVDDGSVDKTSARAAEIDGVEVLTLEKNSGKGAAMRAGLDITSEPVVLFLDADLTNLKHNHISDLLQPVLDDEADMTVGLFRGGRLHTDLAHIVTPSLSGQRAVNRKILDGLDMDSVGFGVERALTELWEKGEIRVTDVILKGMSHRTKEEKRGWFEGVKQRMGMYIDILKFEAGKLKKK